MQAFVDGGVGLPEHGGPGRGQGVVDPAAVGLVVPSFNEPTGDEAVDDGGHGGWANGQLGGKVGGNGRVPVQQTEDPVLGEREVGRREADFHLFGQPCRRPSEGGALVPGFFVSHIVRLSNDLSTSSMQQTGRMDVVCQRTLDELLPGELHAIYRLRCDVFVVEQECAYPDVDGIDALPGTRHVFTGDGVLAYLRWFPEGNSIRIGRVCTRERARGQGLAGGLIRWVIAGHQDRTFVLSAQSHLADWYGTFGFVRSGEEFLEDGIPHVPMTRQPPGVGPGG